MLDEKLNLKRKQQLELVGQLRTREENLKRLAEKENWE